MKPIKFQEVYDFLFLLKENSQIQPLIKIKSNKTVLLHYIVPGFIKFLYKKYQKINSGHFPFIKETEKFIKELKKVL